MAPDQEELRRRLRAARALKGLTQPGLAALIPADAKLSLSTLRKIESGERPLDPRTLRELATRIGVSYEWFLVPDLAEAVEGFALESRLRALEENLPKLQQAVREISG
jgi:transcriptional regulator with XRE-family HTH domain